jgi:hypothetical protein
MTALTAAPAPINSHQIAPVWRVFRAPTMHIGSLQCSQLARARSPRNLTLSQLSDAARALEVSQQHCVIWRGTHMPVD